MRRSIVIGLLVAALIPVAAAAQNCEPDSVAVQILGSGGPQINPFRSSTSYLHIPGTPRPNDGTVRLDVAVVDVTKAEPMTVYDRDGLTVTALGIPHGNMPTLAYRVKVRNMSIVFSSDQTGTDPKFVDFAKGANILIMHLALAAGVKNNPLHAAPDVVGKVAQEAGAGRLIVSHIGIFNLDAALAELKTNYTGPLTVGADLLCTPVK